MGRTNTDKGPNKVDVSADLGYTFVDGYGPEGPVTSNGVVDTPFRDGCHAGWDSDALNIPAYAVYKNHATLVQNRR
jgi:hypothetical protein